MGTNTNLIETSMSQPKEAFKIIASMITTAAILYFIVMYVS